MTTTNCLKPLTNMTIQFEMQPFGLCSDCCLILSTESLQAPAACASQTCCFAATLNWWWTGSFLSECRGTCTQPVIYVARWSVHESSYVLCTQAQRARARVHESAALSNQKVVFRFSAQRYDSSARENLIVDHSHITPHTSHLSPQTSDLTPHTAHLKPQTSDHIPPTSDLRHQTPDLTPKTLHFSDLRPQISNLTPHASNHRRPPSDLTPHNSQSTPLTSDHKPPTSHLRPQTSSLTPRT